MPHPNFEKTSILGKKFIHINKKEGKKVKKKSTDVSKTLALVF